MSIFATAFGVELDKYAPLLLIYVCVIILNKIFSVSWNGPKGKPWKAGGQISPGVKRIEDDMTEREFSSIAKSYIYLDGATGSNLVKAGMPSGVCPEQWILDIPGL